jgi:hypothetical protein
MNNGKEERRYDNCSNVKEREGGRKREQNDDMTDNERDKKTIQEKGESKGRMTMWKIQKFMNQYAYSRKTKVLGGG